MCDLDSCSCNTTVHNILEGCHSIYSATGSFGQHSFQFVGKSHHQRNTISTGKEKKTLAFYQESQ